MGRRRPHWVGETSLSWDREEETPLGWGGDLTELDGEEETSLSWESIGCLFWMHYCKVSLLVHY